MWVNMLEKIQNQHIPYQIVLQLFGDNAFDDCESLSSITIPYSVTSIGRNAFARCSSLLSISIPNSVTSIEDNAFQNCSSLTSIILPDSVTSIGMGTFYSCSATTNHLVLNFYNRLRKFIRTKYDLTGEQAYKLIKEIYSDEKYSGRNIIIQNGYVSMKF